MADTSPELDDEKVGLLIEEIRNFPCLWDKTEKNYKSHDARSKAWFV